MRMQDNPFETRRELHARRLVIGGILAVIATIITVLIFFEHSRNSPVPEALIGFFS